MWTLNLKPPTGGDVAVPDTELTCELKVFHVSPAGLRLVEHVRLRVLEFEFQGKGSRFFGRVQSQLTVVKWF